MKPIEIVGGGLAGLALGRALVNAGVPVTIFEAQHYPRHRVCGEFICGLRDDVRRVLALEPCLADARSHRTMRWHWRERRLRDDVLPRPAVGLSRHTLDQRLADAFVASGGELQVRTRVDTGATSPGRVWATGRRASVNGSAWLGLKAHVRAVATAADLEFYLADGAYVGLAAIEGDAVNVCGLFRRRRDVRAPAGEIMLAYLRACGLGALADRLRAGLDRDTCAAVAALTFDRRVPADRIALGDAHAMIPPFTGDGMAMAFESAALALEPLVDYACERRSWPDTEVVVRARLRSRFARRLAVAGLLQRFLVHPRGQSGFSLLAARGWLPFRALFRILH